MPEISVIMPIYNAQQYLNQSIHSVLNQSFTDFELILINDGSTDYSLLYCKSLAKKDGRIQILDLPHGGVAKAREEGIRAAKGNYISFVDADDWVEKDYLKHLYTAITENNADISMCHMITEASNESETIDYPFESGVYFGTELELLKKDRVFFRNDGMYFLSFCLWDKLYRAELIRDNIRYMDKRAVVATDTLLSTACVLDSKRFSIMDDVDYHYYLRADSIVHIQQQRCPRQRLKELETFRMVLLKIIEEKGHAELNHKVDIFTMHRLHRICQDTREEAYPIPDSLKEVIQSLSENDSCDPWADTIKTLKSYI